MTSEEKATIESLRGRALTVEETYQLHCILDKLARELENARACSDAAAVGGGEVTRENQQLKRENAKLRIRVDDLESEIEDLEYEIRNLDDRA